MNELIQYGNIKDAVVYGFEEYINEEFYNSSQAAARVLEEDWREVNFNSFTKSSYFLNIAIESFKRGEIADFIYEKLDDLIIGNIENIDNLSKEDKKSYQQDLECYKRLKLTRKYNIIENTFEGKARIDYILGLGN